MTANITELAACPFCGGAPRMDFGMVAFEDAEITCLQCSASGSNFSDGPNRDENARDAIAAWNTRTPDIAAMKERIEALEWGLGVLATAGDGYIDTGTGSYSDGYSGARIEFAALARTLLNATGGTDHG